MKTEITICLGSSCFSRGNGKNLELIQEYIKTKGLEAEVNFKGQLCTENCYRGPMLIINSQSYYEVTKNKLIEILEKELNRHE
jgi:NADH:ubiquinone oxidoreductase subunit E